MTYKIEYLKIEIADAGRWGKRAGETARILRRLADQIERNHAWPIDVPLFDINGNVIGIAETKTRRV